MAYSDFTHFTTDSTHSLDESLSTAGNSSLKIDAEASTVAPACEVIGDVKEGKVITKAQSSDGRIGFYFRVQDDSNYYAIVTDHNNDFYNFWENNTKITTQASTNITLDTGTWHTFRSNVWVDSANDLRFRLERSTDGGSTYSKVIDDITVTSPAVTSGGIGVGGAPQSNYNTYFDETEIYY